MRGAVFLICLGMTYALSSFLQQMTTGYALGSPRDMKVAQGRWPVYFIMTTETLGLQEERQTRDLARHASEVWNALGPCREVHNGRACINSREFREIRSRLKHLTYLVEKPLSYILTTRRRRGLINIGGRVSKWLFGTATEEDVRSLAHTVAAARKEGQQVKHVVQELITIVDHALIEHDADHRRLHDMYEVMRRIRNTTQDALRRIVGIERIGLNREVINYIYAARNDILWLRSQQQQVLQDLALGRITTKILPDDLYRSIVEQVSAIGPESLLRSWVQQFGRAIYVGTENRQVVYKIIIPFVGNEEYLAYHIDTFPVPRPNSTIMRQLTPHPDVGYNTRTGDMTVLDDCRGIKPIVCPPTPVYQERALTCERGLVTTHVSDSSDCLWVDLEMTDNTVLRRYGNDWAVITKGEEVSLKCSGKPEECMELPIGVHHATILSTCLLTGNGWRVRGEILGSADINMSFNNTIPLVQFEWDDAASTPEILPTLPPYSSYDDVRPAPSKDHNALADLSQRLDNFEANDDDWIPDDVHDHLAWTTAGVVLIILAILIPAGYYLWKRRKPLRFSLALPRKTKPTPPLTTLKSSDDIETCLPTDPSNVKDVEV